MYPLNTIRRRLGVTQSVLADALGVTQGNVSNYERGQTVPPAVAAKLIEYARGAGEVVTFDEIYGPVAQAAKA